MARVELVYDIACPHVAEARAQLLRAFAEVGQPARWTEHAVGDPNTPVYARGFGSPTVLVDGRDVAGAKPGAAACCRIYPGCDGELRGVPGIGQLVTALAAARPAPRTRTWRATLAIVPGLGAALLPKVACPACWPAYAGFLGSLGLGFLLDVRWLLPLAACFLVLALGALAFRAQRRRGHGPFLVGLVASLLVLAGKFALESDPLMYAGVSLLIAASIWNTWPRRQPERCPACVPPA